jgi:hypothetical protein
MNSFEVILYCDYLKNTRKSFPKFNKRSEKVIVCFAFVFAPVGQNSCTLQQNPTYANISDCSTETGQGISPRTLSSLGIFGCYCNNRART